MRKPSRHCWVLCVALLIQLAIGPAPAQAGPPDKAKWTVIMYMAIDDIPMAAYSSYEVMKLQTVGSSDEVNIVTQIDRATDVVHSYGDWVDGRRFYIEKAEGKESSGDFTVLQSNAVDILTNEVSPAEMGLEEYVETASRLLAGEQSDLDEFTLETFFASMPPMPSDADPSGPQQKSIARVGEPNTADPAPLVDFVSWAVENYPAEHYLLILLGHGSSWIGYGPDHSNVNEDDFLTMDELSRALAEISGNTGVEKFDLIAWHACLMSQIEVMEAIAPYADYTVASEELLSGAALDYVSALGALVENPELTAVDLGKMFVDDYLNYFREVTPQADITLHLLDPSKVGGVLDSLARFAEATQVRTKDDLVAIGLARINTQAFCEADAAYLSTVDLIHFMELLSQLSTDEDVRQSALAVVQAARDMVVYGGANEDYPNANGLTIYFPSNRTDYAISDHDKHYPEQVPGMTAWRTFLDNLHAKEDEILDGSNLSLSARLVPIDDQPYSIYNPPAIVVQTDGVGLVDLEFSVMMRLDEPGLLLELFRTPLQYEAYTPDAEIINEIPEGFSENQFLWDAMIPMLSDGNAETQVALHMKPLAPDSATISGLYLPMNDRPLQAFLNVDMATGEVVDVWGIQDATTSPKMAEIAVRPGDEFQPTLRVFSDGQPGGTVPVDDILTFSDEPLSVRLDPATLMDYAIQMELKDFAGNKRTSTLVIGEIDNEGLDPEFAGHTDLEMGMSFLMPRGREAKEVKSAELTEENAVVRVLTDPAAEIATTLVSFPAKESLQAEYDEVVSQLGDITDVTEPEPVEVDGAEGYAFSYFSADDDGSRLFNRALVTHAPTSTMSYAMTMTAPEDVSQDATEIFDLIVGSTRFFKPLKLRN